MAQTLKTLFGFGKKSTPGDDDMDMDKQQQQQAPAPVPASKSVEVKSLQDVQKKIAEMAANPGQYDPKELAAQLEKMSQALKASTDKPQFVKTAAAPAKPEDPKTAAPAKDPPPPSKPPPKKPLPQNQPNIVRQTKPLNQRQKINNAGGYSFTVCDMMRLKRFIVIGTENGSFYATAKKLADENVNCVLRLIKNGHGLKVLDTLEEYSVQGRVAKDDPILLSLMTCAMSGDEKIQKAAYGKVASICNIPTKLFLFIELCQKMINRKRQLMAPEPQPKKKETGNKRKAVDQEMADLSIVKNIPTESVDTSAAVPAKKRKKEIKAKETLKKVNKVAKKSSGWGRMRRNGISNFYTDEKKDANRLLYLLTKYKSRHNWSHKQVLGYAHPKIKTEDPNKTAKDLVLTYCTRGFERFKTMAESEAKPGMSNVVCEVIGHVQAVHEISQLKPETEGNENKLLDLLEKFAKRDHREDFASQMAFQGASMEPTENVYGRRSSFQIVREHIPTSFLKSVKVWEALLYDMPMTAMIRNLGKMSQLNMFVGPDRKNLDLVINALSDVKRLKGARVHPIKLLIALKIYEQGHGEKGSLQWTVNKEITAALDKAFYLSFRDKDLAKNFKTDKNYMLCLDVSGSMTWQGCYGCEQITPAMASIAMAMVTWNIEDNVDVMAFGGHFESLKGRMRKTMSLTDALSATSMMNFGATDCSLPMTYALQNKIETDVFIVYTDSDTWAGRIHPPQALKKYNDQMARNAKLIVCAMQSNGFTIADPNDPNMMDMCGFDTSVPDIIAEFAKDALSGKCAVCTECKNMMATMQQ